MAAPAAALELAGDLFQDIGEITHRPMMGAAVFYADGQIFACCDREGTLYLRAKGDLAEELASAGAMQFTYTRPQDGATGKMGYWSLPEDALDDPQVACAWAKRALEQD